MKTQSQILFNKISKVFFSGLTGSAEENLVKESTGNNRRVFSSADLWNIQRRRRSLVIR